jgi:hypothetical protein
VHRLLAVLVASVLSTSAVPASGGSDDDVVRRLSVRFDETNVYGRSCREAVSRNLEMGDAAIHFQYSVSGAPEPGSTRYTGHVRFSLGEIVITMPRAIAWANMAPADRVRTDTLLGAIRHHEIGHVRVAEALRDELNVREPIAAADQFAFHAKADAVGREGFARFEHDEREYDRITDHGRRQNLAPGVLAGPDTAIACAVPR